MRRMECKTALELSHSKKALATSYSPNSVKFTDGLKKTVNVGEVTCLGDKYNSLNWQVLKGPVYFP